MSPRTPAQVNEIREKRKAQIMAKALDLFAREGYGHVSISTLANETGISKGLMYNYFESKEHLLREILEHGMNEIIDYFDPNNDGVISSEEFELFIRKTFRIMHEKQEFWLKFYRLIIQPKVMDYFKSKSLIDFIGKFFLRFENYFREKGFEDPQLEVFQMSVIIEGLAAMLIYEDGKAFLPPDLYKKLENRIIKMYT